jgi:PHS family inorganic phosphate transporter-like MFS transporter
MIAVVGSLASAFATFGNSSNTFLLLSLWRVLLGIGVGGIYPLSSVFAYESEASGYSSIPDAQDDENENAVVAVNQDSADKKGSIKSATALFWQLPGQICVYIVAMGLLVFSLPYTYQWRLLLASGAFPFIASSLFLSNSTENRPTLPGTGNESFKATFDALQSVFKDRSQRIQLLGASTAWFLFDIYLYGVGLYSTLILRLIFSSDDLFSNYWENVVAIMASLPAGIFSIYALKYYQLRTLQCVGFTITALSFWVYALLWDTLESKPAYLFILFCYLKFAMACFVPSTTFAMPNSLFDKSVRASCCGIAAASGKLGAFVGTFLFPLVYHSSGFAMVLVYCGLVSSLGLIVTMIAIPAENALETDIRRADVFRQSKKDGIAAHSPRTMKTVSSSEVRQELTI